MMSQPPLTSTPMATVTPSASSVTKTIYFTVSGHNEQAEFSGDDSIEAVRELFRVAAEATENDILKLYNIQGSLINISGRLPSNTPKTRYRLEVVTVRDPAPIIKSHIGCDVAAFQKRLEDLDKMASLQQCEVTDTLYKLKSRVDGLREKFANLDYLSWLGLYKDLSSAPALQPFWNKKEAIPKPPEKLQQVFLRFEQLIQVPVSKDTREYLKKMSFDNWQWDDAEIMNLLRQMFIDLSLVSKFKIEMNVLHDWLRQIYKHYNNVPFHNFKHCFMVTQMMYGLIFLTDLPRKLDDLDILILIISAICHDLDHPGYNNAYQVNARTELALRYNDISPLENHHCSVAFKILENKDWNICRNMEPDMYKRLREGMIKCILATDMAKHHEILKNFKSIIPMFDFNSKEHKDLLMMIMIKTSDISNEVRPLDVASVWVERLFEEYFNQSDMEKLEGLPVTPFMDREKVTKPSAQIGFIKFVLLPLFEALGELFPSIDEDIIQPVQRALDYYVDMQQALDVEKKRKEEDALAAMEGAISENSIDLKAKQKIKGQKDQFNRKGSVSDSVSSIK